MRGEVTVVFLIALVLLWTVLSCSLLVAQYEHWAWLRSPAPRCLRACQDLPGYRPARRRGGPESVSNLAGVAEISDSRPDILAQRPNVTRHETDQTVMNISLHSSWTTYMARYSLLGILVILLTCIEDSNTAVGYQWTVRNISRSQSLIMARLVKDYFL